jgi:hypothetical protein
MDRMTSEQETRPALPTPQAFLSSILESISALPTENVPNIDTVPKSSKHHLLTLHALLPGTLLPALDLLDRNLITRFQTSGNTPVYYARSAPSSSAGRPSRYSRQVDGPVFEVRTTAWYCGCPAFAFTAYDRLIDTGVDVIGLELRRDGRSEFGGLSMDKDVPVCKHLLACVMAENWPNVLNRQINEVEVSREEIAGLAAGWGSG